MAETEDPGKVTDTRIAFSSRTFGPVSMQDKLKSDAGVLLECSARHNLELRKHVLLAAATVLLDDVHRAGQHVGGGMKSDRDVEDGGGRGCAVLQALARGQMVRRVGHRKL